MSSMTDNIRTPISGIYYLKLNGVTVYIGKSTNLYTRIKHHKKEGVKTFDEAVLYAIEDEGIINLTEVALIVSLNPKYNKDCVVTTPTIVQAPNIEKIATTISTIQYKDINVTVSDNRFPTQGQKMYDTGLVKLLKVLSNTEVLRLVQMHETTAIVGKHNLLQIPFKDATPDMNPSTRSKLKKKLIEVGVIHEFGKNKIMLNPYMFLPRKDKNIQNSQYMTQRLWKYIVEDADSYVDGLNEFQDEILPGTRRRNSKKIIIQGNLYNKPKEME